MGRVLFDDAALSPPMWVATGSLPTATSPPCGRGIVPPMQATSGNRSEEPLLAHAVLALLAPVGVVFLALAHERPVGAAVAIAAFALGCLESVRLWRLLHPRTTE